MQMDKYEATGNDFILLKTLPNDPSLLAKQVCDRHFGIGADGLMAPVPSNNADIGMRYFNSDGSEAPMCGNGMRTFARFLHNEKLIKTNPFTVETKGGIIVITMHEDEEVSLDLGGLTVPKVGRDVTEKTDRFTPVTLTVDDNAYKLYVTTLGTLHAVIFVEDFETLDFMKVGKTLSTHPFFPNHININFVKIIDSRALEIKTYERGAGPTLSCGTGVGASSALAHHIKNTESTLRVDVPGGTLQTIVDKTVTLKGPARHIATIEYKGGR